MRTAQVSQHMIDILMARLDEIAGKEQSLAHKMLPMGTERQKMRCEEYPHPTGRT